MSDEQTPKAAGDDPEAFGDTTPADEPGQGEILSSLDDNEGWDHGTLGQILIREGQGDRDDDEDWSAEG